MNEDEILDAPSSHKLPSQKYPLVIFASLIITIPLLIISHINLWGWSMLLQYSSIILALYFFIKKANPNPDNFSFSIWGIVIVFLGNAFSTIGYFFFFEGFTDNFTLFFGYLTGNLFKGIFIGYPLYIGVFMLTKKRNWAMLILMIIISWIFMTMITPIIDIL